MSYSLYYMAVSQFVSVKFLKVIYLDKEIVSFYHNWLIMVNCAYLTVSFNVWYVCLLVCPSIWDLKNLKVFKSHMNWKVSNWNLSVLDHCAYLTVPFIVWYVCLWVCLCIDDLKNKYCFLQALHFSGVIMPIKEYGLKEATGWRGNAHCWFPWNFICFCTEFYT